MAETLENDIFDAERALYGRHNLVLRGCAFEGEKDGESALKESSEITANKCRFDLRYPMWHCREIEVSDCELTENCRAALWYSQKIKLHNTRLHGIKALRECSDVLIEDCDIDSPEFGWSSSCVKGNNITAHGEYFMLRGESLAFDGLELNGKYAFQYIKNSVFDNCVFDTKDAFWHAENVTVRNSLIKGEYLSWYSDGLTLEGCKIYGTQPFCYCRNLRLADCEMIGTDLCFERSGVQARVVSHIDSIKNPREGIITAPSVGEIIRDDPLCAAKIIIDGREA